MNLEALQIMGQLSQDLSQKRRFDIKPALNKEFAGICNQAITSGEWLFGNNISEQLKASRATSNVMRSTFTKNSFRGNRTAPYGNRPTTPFNRNLNWKAPSPQYRRGGFNNRFQSQSSQRGRTFRGSRN
jgi:hypothetical protein